MVIFSKYNGIFNVSFLFGEHEINFYFLLLPSLIGNPQAVLFTGLRMIWLGGSG